MYGCFLVVSQACKPSSVEDDHLSRLVVAKQLQRFQRAGGPPYMLSFQSCTRWGLHSGQVAKPLVSSYLTFPPLRAATCRSRYLSVALSLESPPPGITRHPALWCSDFPHSSKMNAIIQLAHTCILSHPIGLLSIAPAPFSLFQPQHPATVFALHDVASVAQPAQQHRRELHVAACAAVGLYVGDRGWVAFFGFFISL